jgi:alkylation response protein AidB-like acyl-CoA dehydrogenase
VTDAVTIAKELAPRFAERAAKMDASADFPSADIQDLRRAGLFGLLVPTWLGGMGATFTEYVAVAQELARGSGSTALLFNMHASVTGSLATVPDDLARELGAPEAFFRHRDQVLRAAADGAMYAVAITEPGVGSRISATRTTYERDGDGYHLAGRKAVCSGAGHVDAYLVTARASEAYGGTDTDPRVSHFLVPAGEGIAVDATWDPHGMRATASNGFQLDMQVPAHALLGGVEGLALLLAHLMPQWLVASYAAVYVGVARAALDAAITYLADRAVDGTPGALTRLGFVRAQVGRAETKTEAARLVLHDAARRIDASPGHPGTNRAVYRAKLLAGDVAMDVAASMAETCGLGALRRGMALERILRDARLGALMPPSSNVSADVVGTAALGLDPQDGTDISPW